ncbi:unnamed protein product [Aphis gossypii]|uniref:Uncharacterized protein n=1 Tax=Aphis gossypii TaxID=80765 RepID=A0A9P0IYQ5_APHGO|nr:unnamed protein product [Aphis gossypii]
MRINNARRRPSFTKRFIYCLLGANIFLSLFEPPKRDDFTGKSLCRRRTAGGRFIFFVCTDFICIGIIIIIIIICCTAAVIIAAVVSFTRSPGARALVYIRIPILYIIICTYVYILYNTSYILLYVFRVYDTTLGFLTRSFRNSAKQTTRAK